MEPKESALAFVTPRFTKLAVGGDSNPSTCGLVADRALCWDPNMRGQLGDRTTIDRNVPTRVGGGLEFTALSAGSGLTCEVATSGAVYCWGKVNDRVVTAPTRIPVLGE